MHKPRSALRIGILASAIILLAGCTSAPPGPQVTFDQLQNPENTPKEKWSDATNYMVAMGIWGMRDVPREMMSSAVSVQTDERRAPGVVDAPMVGMAAVAPPTGMSGGAALGLGVGLMLLSAPPIEAAMLTQIAAWVPADLASSPEEAAKVAERAFHEAREKVFAKKLPQEIFTTAYPASDSRIYGNRFPKNSNILTFDSPAKQSPVFVTSQKSYGPIFMYGNKITQEAALNAPGLGNIEGMREQLIALSAELPEWFVIYDKEKSFSKTRRLPPAVLHKGDVYYFIGK